MKRKIVKQGAATMMVSLPSKWVKKNNLEKGDEVDIDEQDKELIITPEKKVEKKKQVTIDITPDKKDNIYPILTHAYRRGFDKIILKARGNFGGTIGFIYLSGASLAYRL